MFFIDHLKAVVGYYNVINIKKNAYSPNKFTKTIAVIIRVFFTFIVSIDSNGLLMFSKNINIWVFDKLFYEKASTELEVCAVLFFTRINLFFVY